MLGSLWSRLIPTRRRVVIYVVVLIGVLVVRLVLDLWAGSRLRSVSAPLAAAYGGLDLASLSPPPVAPYENRARIASAAAALTLVQEDTLRRAELNQAIVGKVSTMRATRETILRQVTAENRLALQVLDAIESRPKANWELGYDDGPRMRMPSLLAIRDLSSVSAAAALVALADGNADEAVRRARLGLMLADSLEQEPNLLMQLIRMAVAGVQCRVVREVLIAGEPSAAALQPLALLLDRGRAHDPVETGLVGELKFINSMLVDVERGAVPLGGFREDRAYWSRPLVWVVRPAVLAGHARILDERRQMIEYARLQPFERDARKLRLPLDEPQPWWWRKISPVFLAGLIRSIRPGDEHRALVMLTATSVALRRYRLDRGHYPASLDELAPALLPRGPIDPFTGRPPEYTPLAAGFQLRVQAPQGMAAPARDLLTWMVPR